GQGGQSRTGRSSSRTMNLERLKLFAAVVEHHGFSPAARRLRVTKSHVSQSVAQLQADLRARLLQRTTRRVAPTPEGAALYAQVAPHLAALAGAPRLLERERDAIAGELRVTTTQALGEALLAPIVGRFCAKHPAMRVRVTLTSRFTDLVA